MSVEFARTRGRANGLVRNDVDIPLRTTELVGLADSSDKMRAGVETRLGKRAIRLVGVLDVDGTLVLVEVAKGPSSVLVPDKLTPSTARLDLIVSRRLSGLPDVIASLDGEVAIVVVDTDKRDGLAAST